MRVHKDEPVTLYPEYESSSLATGLEFALLLLLLLLLSSLVLSFQLARHFLF